MYYNPKGKIIAPLKQLWVEMKRKSRAGIEYSYYKPTVIVKSKEELSKEMGLKSK